MKRYEGKDVESILTQIEEKENVAKEDIVYFVVEEKKGLLGLNNKIVIDAYTTHDLKDFVYTYLNDYFDHASLIVNIYVRYENNGILVSLDGTDNGVLIGKFGKTLTAMTNLVKAAVKAQFRRYYPVLIDVNGYKDHRYSKVTSQALRIAKEVQQTKITAVLDPMPNDERKAIHQYLMNMPHVRTVSEGEGNNRKITIVYDAEKM